MLRKPGAPESNVKGIAAINPFFTGNGELPMNKKIWLVGLLGLFASWQSWAQTCSSNHGPCSITQQGNEAVIWLTGLDLTTVPSAAFTPAAVPPDPADETLRCRYSFSATLFSSLSPQIALLSSDDLNSLPHRLATYTDAQGDRKCAVRITFPGKVFQIYLNVSGDGSALSNYNPTPEPEKGFKGWFKHWLQDTTEAPGATDIQVGWNPSFNAPQKVNIVATFQPMKSFKSGNYHNESQTLAEKQWYGIFAAVDKEDRAQQDPDSIVTTFDYVFRSDPADLTPNLGLSFRPPWFEARTGTELSPKSDVLNQINAVYSRWPLVFSSTEQRSFLTLTPVAGIEAGTNFQNHTVVPTHDAIFRWVAGTDASLRVPPAVRQAGRR